MPSTRTPVGARRSGRDLGRARGLVGPRGLSLLAAVGLVGVVLAVHGWSSRGSGPLSSAIGVNSQRSGSRGGGASPASSPRPGPTVSTGPLLTSEPYASYAFQVWPGQPSTAARAAAAGLTVSVRRDSTGIQVSVSVNGQAAGSAHSYSGGTRVYIVEASLGDDSGNSDYNLGDDGLVVTDAAGRIVQ